MVIDFSNPVHLFLAAFAAFVLVVGIALYLKGILVEAQVEAARRIRAEEEEERRNKNLGKRI